MIKKYIGKQHHLKAYLGASAIGFYGDRGTEILDERSEAGEGFLSESCQLWEAATEEIRATGLRTITLRIGVVLSSKGGALEKMILPFKLGIGSYLGDGKQIYSWVHIDDVVGIMRHLLLDDHAYGTFNAVAPTPLNNYAFTKMIKDTGYPRSLILPAPALAIKFALGEMSHVVLDSSKVSSAKIEKIGYKFRLPLLKEGLERNISEEGLIRKTNDRRLRCPFFSQPNQ